MEGEYFYAAVLEDEGAKTTWHSGEDGAEEQSPLFKLVIKQVLLGHMAVDGEYNVVEVETMSANAAVKIPIAVLKAGETRTSMVNLEFPEAPVTFKLIKGKGPVYIHGNIISTYMEQVDEAEDECTELIEEEQEDETRGDNRKRKISENGSNKSSNGSSNNQKAGKKQKTG